MLSSIGLAIRWLATEAIRLTNTPRGYSAADGASARKEVMFDGSGRVEVEKVMTDPVLRLEVQDTEFVITSRRSS
jgi:hypothetical protein